MAWEDLSAEVGEMFAGLASSDEPGLSKRPGWFWDEPHRDAEAWIKATEEERAQMRPAFDELLKKRRAEIAWRDAKHPRPKLKAKPRKRAEYMREYRQRLEARKRHLAALAAYRAKHRPEPKLKEIKGPRKRGSRAAYHREWRARKKAA